jgi:hypothetical protein
MWYVRATVLLSAALIALAAAAPRSDASGMLSVSARLRSASATIAVPADRSTSGAPVVYTVGGRSAHATIAVDDANNTLKDAGFRLLDVTGIGYPILMVNEIACARDCTESALFYRFDPAGPSLDEQRVYQLDATPAQKSLGPCFAIKSPQLLYTWNQSSAIPIRPAYLQHYYAARLDDGAFVVINQAEQYDPSAHDPATMTLDPLKPLAGTRVRRGSNDGAPDLFLCK